MSKIKSKGKRGFTLTEILVVVMIISVLTAIAYPLYTKAATKSRAIEAINLLEMVRNKQLQKFAKDKSYYSSFTNMGQLTVNKNKEVVEGAVLKVKDYTLSLNNIHSCMTAAYDKGGTKFSFSSSYEYTGLGCTGDVCSSFGDIVGTAKDVCNCGSKACSNGYTLNEDTCNCDCLLGCNQGGTCYAPYGGGSTRPCSSGCGTENSANSCNGAVWSGTCWSPTQTQPTSQGCGNSGTQTRTCSATCGGGSCGSWGACTGQTCPASTKPSASEACGNCGTRTRTVSCDSNTGSWTTGSWGSCTGQGVCAVGNSQSCGTGGTQTCTSSCAWGSCTGQDCPAASKPSTSQSCGNCNLGTQTRTVTCNTSTYAWATGSWGTCTGGGVCASGNTQSCGTGGTQTCTYSCTWGACSGQDCPAASKPATTQSCGNCSTGTQTRTVTCNTSTYTWTTGTWGTCSGGGACASGATQACGGNGTQTCSSSCSWNTCSCPSGYTWNGTTCALSSCDPATKPSGGPNDGTSCGACGKVYSEVTCDTSTYTWKVNSSCNSPSDAQCPSGSTQSCGDGKGTMTCSDTCKWNTCVCSGIYAWNGTTCACPAATPYEYGGKCNQCPSGQYVTNGKCCPTDQVSLNGTSCVYAYKPERVSVGILIDCHETYSFINTTTCRRTGSLSYFIGGSLPYVPAGDGCTAHYSYYNGGLWWSGGQHQGYSLPSCYGNDQDICDSYCTAASCTYKCIVSQTTPSTCGVYTCSNGRHCDNNSGSGTMLRCVRK